MITDYDLEHIGEIIAGDGDWFTAQLLRLMHKADSENFAKLAHAFPDVGAAYLMWHVGENASDPAEMLRKPSE
jgi:hypothetical protein